MRFLVDSVRLPVVFVALLLALLVQPGVASAHTDLDFTTPADGDTVAEPVDEVTVAFTAPVELVGEGFEALDPQGNLLRPPVISDDGQVFRLLFDPPLAGGGVGIRYEIRADDGHVISDSFSFVVDAPAPTTAPATVATTAPATEPPVTTAPAPEATDPAVPASTTSVAATTTASPTTAGTSTTAPVTEPSDDGSNSGLVLAIAAAAAIGVGGFFLIRARTSGAS